jgi:hypothetical protein
MGDGFSSLCGGCFHKTGCRVENCEELPGKNQKGEYLLFCGRHYPQVLTYQKENPKIIGKPQADTKTKKPYTPPPAVKKPMEPIGKVSPPVENCWKILKNTSDDDSSGCLSVSSQEDVKIVAPIPQDHLVIPKTLFKHVPELVKVTEELDNLPQKKSQIIKISESGKLDVATMVSLLELLKTSDMGKIKKCLQAIDQGLSKNVDLINEIADLMTVDGKAVKDILTK